MPLTLPLRRSKISQALSCSVLALAFTASACANESNTKSTSAEPAQIAETVSQKTAANTQHEGHNHTSTHTGTADNEAQDANQAATPQMPMNVEYVTTEAPNEHVLGDSAAPVTVIAYASVTCPHCGDWFTNQWPQFKTDLIETGKVRFIFREFPTQPVQLAMAGFLVANCADESRFFESIEYQMENQKSIFEAAEAGKGRETYVAIAETFGLSGEGAMEKCLSDQTEVDKIALSVARAQAGNVSGAPAFFINETLFKGNPTFDALNQVIAKNLETGFSKMDKSLIE